jgi:hypothetical protein
MVWPSLGAAAGAAAGAGINYGGTRARGSDDDGAVVGASSSDLSKVSLHIPESMI